MPMIAAPMIMQIMIQIMISLAMTLISYGLRALMSPKGGGGSNAQAATHPGVTFSVTEPASPWQIIVGRRHVAGRITMRHVNGDQPAEPPSLFTPAPNPNKYLHLVVTWAGCPCEEVEEVRFNGETVPIDEDGNAVGKYAGKVKIFHYLGADETMPEAMAAMPEKWTEHHRQSGRTKSYIQLTWDQTLFAGGPPQINAVIKGYNLIRDPRDDSIGYTANGPLVVAGVMANSDFGLGIDHATGFEQDLLIEAANVADEIVPRPDGSDEPRYEVNGAWTCDEEIGSVLGRMITALGTQAIMYSGGQWMIRAGAMGDVSDHYTEDDIREGYSFKHMTPRASNANVITGTFMNPNASWQETDFPAVSSDLFLSLDGGVENVKPVKLDFTISPGAAQRIARIDLRRSRTPAFAEDVPFKLSAWRSRAGSVISLTIPRLGWDHKTFEVTRTELATGQSEEGDAVVFGVNVSLREISEDIFSWTASDEKLMRDGASTNLPDILNPLPAANLHVDEERYIGRSGGGVKVRAILTWNASGDEFVRSGGGYIPMYRTYGATDWITGPRVTTLFHNFDDLTPGNYEFGVNVFNSRGVEGAEPVIVVREIGGMGALPIAPQNMTIQTIAGHAVLQFSPTDDVDMLTAGEYVFRHTTLNTASATWEDGIGIGNAVPASQVHAVLPLKPGTYMAKGYNRQTMQWSDDTALAYTTQSTALTFSPITSLVEHPTFSGTKTNCVADDSVLKLTGEGDFDDVDDVDEMIDWDYPLGVIVASGVYEFPKLDLGSVIRARLTSHVVSTVLNVVDDFDTRALSVDEWPSWDGDVTGNEADGRVFFRTTSDDPASGGATWSTWNGLDSTEIMARGIDAKYVMNSYDPVFSIWTDELAIFVDEVT